MNRFFICLLVTNVMQAGLLFFAWSVARFYSITVRSSYQNDRSHDCLWNQQITLTVSSTSLPCHWSHYPLMAESQCYFHFSTMMDCQIYIATFSGLNSAKPTTAPANFSKLPMNCFVWQKSQMISGKANLLFSLKASSAPAGFGDLSCLVKLMIGDSPALFGDTKSTDWFDLPARPDTANIAFRILWDIVAVAHGPPEISKPRAATSVVQPEHQDVILNYEGHEDVCFGPNSLWMPFCTEATDF